MALQELATRVCLEQPCETWKQTARRRKEKGRQPCDCCGVWAGAPRVVVPEGGTTKSKQTSPASNPKFRRTGSTSMAWALRAAKSIWSLKATGGRARWSSVKYDSTSLACIKLGLSNPLLLESNSRPKKSSNIVTGRAEVLTALSGREGIMKQSLSCQANQTMFSISLQAT